MVKKRRDEYNSDLEYHYESRTNRNENLNGSGLWPFIIIFGVTFIILFGMWLNEYIVRKKKEREEKIYYKKKMQMKESKLKVFV